MLAIFGADRHCVLIGIDSDFGVVQTFLAVRVLDRVHLDFVSVPRGHVHRPIDSFQFDTPAWRKRVSLVKLLGEFPRSLESTAFGRGK